MCPRFERKKGIKSSDFVIAEIGFKKTATTSCTKPALHAAWERGRDDFPIWFRPGASVVVFIILPSMILLNQNVAIAISPRPISLSSVLGPFQCVRPRKYNC